MHLSKNRSTATAGGSRRRQFSLGTVVRGVASLVVFAAAWYFLAPSQLGGSSAYVITYGTSMQPAYHAGDLAVVKQAGSYHVGEIVAYRNAQLGNHIVLHRIIGIANGHYTFKGDNNNFVDSFHPTQSELVGHLWVHVPAVGKYLQMLHGPRIFLIAGLIALLLIAGLAVSRARTGRARVAPTPSPVTGGSTFGSLGLMPAVAVVALVACAALGALSYARPLSATAMQPGLYTQAGHFSYDASAPGGHVVYGGSSVSTGQPIFLRLVKRANFHFEYTFESKGAHSLAGHVGLLATISAPDGWKRTLHLVGTRSFSGDHVSVTGSVDLPKLNRLLNKVGQLSNVTGGTFALTLEPHVDVHGAVAGDKVDDNFSPKLGFLLDSYQLQLQPGTVSGPSSTSLLTQSTSGSGPVTVANTVTLLKLKLAVAQARRTAVFGGALAVVALLSSLWWARRRRPRTIREGIEQQFGELIVDVETTPRGLELPTVGIGSIDGLVRVAEQLGRVILHLENDEADIYFVEDNGFVYTYQPAADASAEVEHARVAGAPIVDVSTQQ